MDLSCLEMNRLESLSNGELLELADTYGLDIPVSHQRVCIIEELLDYGRKNSSAENNVSDGNDTAGNDDAVKEECEDGPAAYGVAALPKHYNISFIGVNIRDPLWIFVFWEIKTQERELHENAPDFEGYCLRAVQLTENGMAGAVAFTVAVGADDISRYLGFPPGGGRIFQVELCALHGTGGVVLAVSRPFTLPRLIDNHNGDGIAGNPLAQLSGAENYTLTRSVDRLPRSREL
jgi:hypothetical protein